MRSARQHAAGSKRPASAACIGVPRIRSPQLWRRVAVGFLSLRSHWLRMPFGLLVRHLWHQARRRGGLKTAQSVHLGG